MNRLMGVLINAALWPWDRLAHMRINAELWVCDRIAGPLPETEADRIRERDEAEKVVPLRRGVSEITRKFDEIS